MEDDKVLLGEQFSLDYDCYAKFYDSVIETLGLGPAAICLLTRLEHLAVKRELTVKEIAEKGLSIHEVLIAYSEHCKEIEEEEESQC